MKRTRASADGVIMVLFALIVTGLIAIVALLIVAAYLAANSTRMQQYADVAALAALEEYVSQGDDNPVPSPSPRAEQSRAKANSILGENTILGAISPLGGLKLPWESSGDGGELVFGGYYNANPSPGDPDPCTPYPCFVPNDTNVNAVQVNLRNEASNPITAPFAAIFGSDQFHVAAHATAALVQRCNGFVLDISGSVTEASHNPPYAWSSATLPPPGARTINNLWSDSTPSPLPCANLPLPGAFPKYVVCPSNNSYGLYAMRKNNLRDFESGDQQLAPVPAPPNPDRYTQFPAVCDGDQIYQTADGTVWCNIIYQNGNASPAHRTSLSDSGHFRQDYREMRTKWGIVRYDAHSDPQPLSDLLLSFNAAFRVLRQQSTSGDYGMILAFGSVVTDVYPDPLVDGIGVTNDLDYLIQLTNVNNRGKLSAVSNEPIPQPTFENRIDPNFMTRGWFYLFGQPELADSNMITAIDQTIQNLQQYCPPASKKSLLIATDGIMTCDGGGCPGFRDYATYSNAVTQLLDATNPTGILKRLRDAEISLSVILTGRAIEPNIRNISNGTGGFLSLDEARYLLMDSNPANDPAIIDYGCSGVPGCSGGGMGGQQQAFEQYGDSGVVFRHPNFVFGTLALLSGGEFCPLMPTCERPQIGSGTCPSCPNPNDCTSCPDDCPGCPAGESCYDPTTHRLRDDCARVLNTTQKCSLVELSPGEQAARCAQTVVAQNPYILVNPNTP